MDILHNMRFFVAVSETGSFTSAAKLLDTSTTNVSRAIAQLETHLSSKLVNRTTRKLSLTEAGQRYLARSQEILRSVEEAENEAGDAHRTPVGRIKVHAMTSIGQHLVIRTASEFRKIYPGVSFNLTLANRIPDILSEGFDVSIVMASELPDSGFISQKLGQTYSIVCASQSYVDAHGIAHVPNDLRRHDCLRIVSPVVELDNWRFHGPHGEEVIKIRDAAFEVNTADAMISAISSGMGVGVLPIYVAFDAINNGTLVRMLPEYRMQELNIYAIYPSRQYLDAKVKAWLDLLRKVMPDMLSIHDAKGPNVKTADI